MIKSFRFLFLIIKLCHNPLPDLTYSEYCSLRESKVFDHLSSNRNLYDFICTLVYNVDAPAIRQVFDIDI